MFAANLWITGFLLIVLWFQINCIMEQIIKHTKYIDPMVDVAFKQIFGQKKNKRLIKELLEHVFSVKITELAFVNVEHPGETKADRNAVFDLQCSSEQIGDFIVEVQVKEQAHFDKRALYYSTFPITAQAPKGKWNYDLKPVFFLGLLNFSLPGTKDKPDECIHRYSIRNNETNEQLTDSLQFVFMEVKKFNKPRELCKTFEDKFLYYFKNLPTFASKPDTQQDSYFEELLAAAEYSNMTKAEREAYNRRLKVLRDNYAAEEFAREKAAREREELAREREKLAREREELAREREKAIGEAVENALRETAAKLLAMGLSPEQISQATSLGKD